MGKQIRDRAADFIAGCWPNGRGIRKDDSKVLAAELAKAGLLALDQPDCHARVRPVVFWQAACDRCGTVEDDYGDYAALAKPEDAVQSVLDSDWHLHGEGEDEQLLCDDCFSEAIEMEADDD